VNLIPVAEKWRSPLKNIWWHQFVLPGLVKKLDLDVLHVPSYRRLIWRRPCALVATIHDLAPFRVSKKYDWARMIYGRVVAKRLAKRQHEVIAISRNTAQDIQTFFNLPATKLNVVHNGLDHAKFYPLPVEEAKAEARKMFSIEKPFLLYVARLEHPGKNHVRLVTAFNQFKSETCSDWQLVLVGSDWSGAEVIHRRIKESPFNNDILCLGFVHDDQLPILYRAADLFVYPSLYEGFGMPPVEAMACGSPVLSSHRGSLEEVVGEAAAQVDPEDITAMKWQLIRLTSDPAAREQLRSAGFKQAQRFSWERSARQTMEVYARACHRARVRPIVMSASLAKQV
jgi:glycosyltransferase involved in cell wall biosynthesis